MQKQRGWAGIAMMTGLVAIMGTALTFHINQEQKKRAQQSIDQAGRDLQDLTFAVMKLISEQGTSVTPGTYVGSNWLQGASCGGTAADEYLTNCNFRDINPFGDTYSTNISITGGVVTAITRVDYPVYKEEVNPVFAARIRAVGASYLSGSTPVSQTFSDYALDRTNEQIVVTTSTAPSTDIWYRTDGSNQMNADANFGGNAMYNVSSLYGATTASEDINTTITVGSAMEVAGVLTIDSGVTNNTANSGHLSVNTFNDAGYSVIAAGGLSTAFVDSYGVISVGDGSGATSNARIIFNQNGTTSDVTIESDDAGDLEIRNSNGDATVIADRFYTESINRFSDQALYNLTVVRSGASVPKPNCRAGLTPQIFTAIQGLASNPARPISAFDIQPVDTGSAWTINVHLKTDGPGNVPNTLLESRVMVAVKCS